MTSPKLKEVDIEGSASKEDVPYHEGVTKVKDGDAALTFLRRESTAGQMSTVDEKRLVRKIDWMIMPLMWSCYCLQYLDKTLSMPLYTHLPTSYRE